jgi:hypothetical protein
VRLLFALGMMSAAVQVVAAPIAPPNSSAQCEVLPNAPESKKLTLYQELPLPIRVELNKRLEQSDRSEGFVGPLMAEGNSDWSRAGNRVNGLAQRRFIQGGQYKNRWYVWYVHSGRGSHTYHMVIANLVPATSTGQLIEHLVTADTLDTLCELTTLFMQNPESPPKLDDNQFW